MDPQVRRRLDARKRHYKTLAAGQDFLGSHPRGRSGGCMHVHGHGKGLPSLAFMNKLVKHGLFVDEDRKSTRNPVWEDMCGHWWEPVAERLPNGEKRVVGWYLTAT